MSGLTADQVLSEIRRLIMPETERAIQELREENDRLSRKLQQLRIDIGDLDPT